MELKTRIYGKPPYHIALLHGGPGAAGYLLPIAKKLSAGYGIIETIQNKDSIKAQLEELLTDIKNHADLPVTLVGHSCGAWLACLFE